MTQYQCEKCGHMITCVNQMWDSILCDKCGFLNENKMERWWVTIEIKERRKNGKV